MLNNKLFDLEDSERKYTRPIDSIKYTGKVFYVVDDQDTTVESYKNYYGDDSVCVFSKKKVAETIDVFDNFDFMNVVVYARNAMYDIAKEKDYKWFIVLDDDYHAVRFMIDGKHFNFFEANATLDYLFLETFNFFEKTNLKIFSWAQGADLFIVKHICKRKAMNVFFCSTERRVKFLGKINEDVNMFSRYNQLGDMMLTIPIVFIEQKQTQTHTGMTEAYLAYGTYHKSFYSVIQCPSFIKVCVYPYSGSNCHTQNRIHHFVDTRHGYPCLISNRYKKEV